MRHGMLLYGQAPVQITSRTILASSLSSATATYNLNSDGTVTNQLGTLLENWLLSGLASDFEVRATLQSGTLTSGATGTWDNLGTTRSWSLTNVDEGTIISAVILVEIRPAVGGVAVASATITLSARVKIGTGGGTP